MLVIVELVEVETGLLAFDEVRVKGTAAVTHDKRLRRLAADHAFDLIEAFREAHRALVALHDAARLQNLVQRLHDHVLTLRHAERERLQHQKIAVAVHDHAGQTVGLAPDEAAQAQIDSGGLARLHRALDASREEVLVEVLAAVGEKAGADLRFGIVNGAAERLSAHILQAHHISRLRITGAFLDFGGIDPHVTVKEACAGLDDECGHEQLSKWRMTNVECRMPRAFIRHSAFDIPRSPFTMRAL